MKTKRIIPVNLINLAVVLTVMLFVAMTTQNIITELTIRDIQNVTRLTHTNIYAELKQILVEPVNTSVIMAQNTLLFDFMDQDTSETEKKMADYLSAIQEATGYESVFLIPDSTLSYYHPGGTDSKVDLNSDASAWYKARIHAKDAYSMYVNTEQLDDGALTVYIDANINNKNGDFVGVTGVGSRITHLQKILNRYLDNHGVQAYLIDKDGIVQVHEDNHLIKSTSFYDLENIKPQEMDIKKSRVSAIEKMIDNRFIIVHYIPMLDWYLVVEKSTSELTGALNYYSLKVLLALIVGTTVILLVTNYVISMYKKQIISLSNIDHLTDVPNRTIFEHSLESVVKNRGSQKFCLALFDLDNLKKINDNLGHDKGDEALKKITEVAKEVFKEPDFVSRVGGDEFAIIIHKSQEESILLLENFKNGIKEHVDLQKVGATVSIGVTESNDSDTKTAIYKRVDKALYKSKNSGKDRIHVL